MALKLTPRGISFYAFLLLSAGCTDGNDGKEVVEDDDQETETDTDTDADSDTDTDADSDTDTDTDVDDYPGVLEPLTPLTDISGNCVADSAGMVNWSGKGISAYNTVGYDGSVRPPSSSVFTARVDGACPGETAGFRSTNPGSGGIDPQTGDEWNANSGINTLGDCYLSTACGTSEADSCNGSWEVEITPESGYSCSDYDTVRIDLEPKYAFAMRKANTTSDCSAGAGRFALLPLNKRDRDRDGKWAMTFLPIQLSGTGVMTNKAWITDIDAVTIPTGNTLRVIKPNAQYAFNGSDLLVNYSTVSYAITGSHDFDSGLVSGNAAFVVEGVSADDLDGFVVDMEWECGSVSSPITQAQGYQFRLSDIGCDPVQKLTMRYRTSPNRVQIEQYGNPNYVYTSPTTTVTGGQAFSIGIGRLQLDGVITSTTSQQAVVDLTTIAFDGVSACEPDTYTFGVE